MKHAYASYQSRQLARLLRKCRALLSRGLTPSHRGLRVALAKLQRLMARIGQARLSPGLRTGLAALAVACTGASAHAQQFSTPSTDVFGLQGGRTGLAFPTFGDIDGDGDLDALSVSYASPDQILFAENTGTKTAPAFAAPVANPFGIQPATGQATFPAIADLDGDGDADLLLIDERYEGGAFINTLTYFENTGSATAPAFGAGQELRDDLPEGVYLNAAIADLDGDGDADLLLARYYGDGPYFLENTSSGGTISFASATADVFGLTSAGVENEYPTVADLDGDGDLDILTTTIAYSSNGYATDYRYYENTGTATEPQFGTGVVDPFGLSAGQPDILFGASLADIDGDGDADLFQQEFFSSGTDYDYALSFRENTEIIIGTREQLERVGAFPNPATTEITLATEAAVTEVDVYDATGRLVLHATGDARRLDVRALQPGVFQLVAVLEDGTRQRASFVRE